MSARLTAYLFMLVVSVIWGVAGPVIKFTLSDFPPLIFLTYRFAISSVVALTVFAITRPRLPQTDQETGNVLAYSVLAVTLGLGLLFFGFDKTTSLTGSVISAMAPLATVIAGAIFLREHVTKIERLGIFLAFLGTTVTILGPLWLNGFGTDAAAQGFLEGNLLIVASIVVDIGAALLVKVVIRQGISPSTLAHLSFIVGFATLLPATLVVHGPWGILSTIAKASWPTHLGVWYMALLSGTLAYSLRNLAVKSIEVSEVAVFSYLYPLWAAPLAVWWLGEKITTPFVLGAAIIAVGVTIAEHKRRQKRPVLRRRHR